MRKGHEKMASELDQVREIICKCCGQLIAEIFREPYALDPRILGYKWSYHNDSSRAFVQLYQCIDDFVRWTNSQ